MKVTTTYLESLLKQKKIQRLEKQTQVLEKQIRDIKADLQTLERPQSWDLLDGAPNSKSLEIESGETPQGRPWGNYVFLILLMALLIGSSFIL